MSGPDKYFFHLSHIVHLSDFLNEQFPSGYLAMNIESMQAQKKGISSGRAVGVFNADWLLTQIELLWNYEATYLENRIKTLQTGVNLVELVYHPEIKSPLSGVPIYPDDPQAQPYSIAANCPEKNTVAFYPFGINQEIPTIAIPLEEELQIVFDFNAVYQYTYEAGRWGELPAIDYEQEPLRMHAYSEHDQQLIREHLKSLKK